MKKTLALIILQMFCLSNLACSEDKKGNPQLVKDVQELVRMGCACTTIKCFYDVNVNGQGYIKLRLSAGVKDLKEEERTQFNQALNQWSICEHDMPKIKKPTE